MATVQLSQSHHQILNLHLGPLPHNQVHPFSHPVLTTVCPLATHIKDTFAVWRKKAPVLYRISLLVAAVLRDISEGTSYQTVRLVFRHYAHLSPSSCTSERLRPSSALSHTFSQNTHSSLSFGSHPYTPPLSAPRAHMISLVRVTRRVGQRPLVRVHFHFASCSFHTSIALLLRYRSSVRI